MATNAKRPPAGAQKFNRVAVMAAGSRFFPLWATAEHRGRKSGKSYTTPIAIAASTTDSLFVALPWGSGTDWVRNLQAAGGGTVRWKGVAHAVSEPTIVSADEPLAAAGGIQRRMLARWRMEHYLRLHRASSA
ncbi:nitroreductase family deazaflavin-dependent oxidoreductase [Oryzobacter telluris]|uniref:nitroreductase family deazaflavin-dependent oxidoreductase n=1 Tax=Oryzobacter telluris TaxID=3149179 RepID=UPI00370D4ECE